MAGIDGAAAHLSDTLFTTAISVYALAAVGFTAEYSFGRVGRAGATARAESRERALVGAGGPDVVAPPAGGTTPAPADSGLTSRQSRAERIGRWSVVVLLVGAIVHAASIVVRAVAVDAVPWSNMYEFASAAGLIAVIAFLALLWKMPQIRFLGGFVLLPVTVLMFLAGTVFYSKAQPLVPALQSYWLAIHVTLAAVSEGAFMTSAVLTALYLVKVRYGAKAAAKAAVGGGGATGSAEKQAPRRDHSLATLAARLPSAETLDKAAYRIVVFSFPLYTVAIICGAIWAEAAWGRYWGWDPKETWAFIVWVVYAAYLHARATAGLKGRPAAWVNLIGFAAITFNFVIVNVVVSGLHSYAGLS